MGVGNIFKIKSFNELLAKSPNVSVTHIAGDELTKTTVKHIKDMLSGEYYVGCSSFNVLANGFDMNSQKISQAHGVSFGIGTYTNRQLIYNGVIYAKDRQGKLNGMRAIYNIFRFAYTPNIEEDGFYKLIMTDELLNEYFVNASVTNISIEDLDWNPFFVGFTVTFQTSDENIYYNNSTITNIEESYIGGAGLSFGGDFSFGTVQLSQVLNPQYIITDSNSATDFFCRISLNPLVDNKIAVNPILWHAELGSFIKFDITINDYDIIEIDSALQTVKLNGVIASSIINDESSFFSLLPKSNNIILVDETHPSIYGYALQASIEYTNIL